MVGNWKGHVEKFKNPDGFLGLMERARLQLRSDGSAILLFQDSEGQYKRISGNMIWRLKERKLILSNPKNPRDTFAMTLRKDNRTLDDALNSGNGLVFVYRKE